MKTLSEAQFLAWAQTRGIVPDPRYPNHPVLAFEGCVPIDRFWCVPPEPEARPYFIQSLLLAMGNWSTCFAWKPMGSWPASADPERINDIVQLRLLKGLGLALGNDEVLQFSSEETDVLISLIYLTTVFGWSVSDDLHIFPDHGRQMMATDHHGVIGITCRSEEDMMQIVARMEEEGYPLPTEIPDETFKWPYWMNKNK